MPDKELRRKIVEGRLTVGVMVQEFATLGMPQITAGTGVDFILYDTEHTGWSIETIKGLLTAGRGCGLPAIVRVPVNDYRHIAHFLDVGADGLVLPMVQSRAALDAAVAAAYYPPLGHRGCSFGLLHDGYRGEYGPGELPAMLAAVNESVIVIAQIESVAGVAAAEEICSHPLVHAIWVGNFDLSCSLGRPGDFEHTAFREAASRVQQACQAHGKPMVAGGSNAAALQQAARSGCRVLVHTSDHLIYQQALKTSVAQIRQSL